MAGTSATEGVIVRHEPPQRHRVQGGTKVQGPLCITYGDLVHVPLRENVRAL